MIQRTKSTTTWTFEQCNWCIFYGLCSAGLYNKCRLNTVSFGRNHSQLKLSRLDLWLSQQNRSQLYTNKNACRCWHIESHNSFNSISAIFQLATYFPQTQRFYRNKIIRLLLKTINSKKLWLRSHIIIIDQYHWS